MLDSLFYMIQEHLGRCWKNKDSFTSWQCNPAGAALYLSICFSISWMCSKRRGHTEGQVRHLSEQTQDTLAGDTFQSELIIEMHCVETRKELPRPLKVLALMGHLWSISLPESCSHHQESYLPLCLHRVLLWSYHTDDRSQSSAKRRHNLRHHNILAVPSIAEPG